MVSRDQYCATVSLHEKRVNDGVNYFQEPGRISSWLLQDGQPSAHGEKGNLCPGSHVLDEMRRLYPNLAYVSVIDVVEQQDVERAGRRLKVGIDVWREVDQLGIDGWSGKLLKAADGLRFAVLLDGKVGLGQPMHGLTLCVCYGDIDDCLPRVNLDCRRARVLGGRLCGRARSLLRVC
jgi:hypothetical protein